MSATRDKSHKATFVYSNIIRIARKPLSSPPAHQAELSAPVVVRERERIEEYRPAEFIGKRLPAPAVIPSVSPSIPPLSPPSNEAIEGLKENLKTLNDLHSKLRFMLVELEELLKS